LRRVFSHCGVRKVRLIPSSLRALYLNFFEQPPQHVEKGSSSALRRVFSHCGVRKVRRIPHEVALLESDFFLTVLTPRCKIFVCCIAFCSSGISLMYEKVLLFLGFVCKLAAKI
jgi:hypothetical protein